MPLTDPELDLLREMLEDDPADEAFLQVGEELVRRSRWGEAEEILSRGLAHHPEARGFELLARAALETGRFDLALSALERIERDPAKAPENARVEILAFERSGRLDDARRCAQAFLGLDPHDVVVQAVIERLDAPPPAADQRAADPFYTVERAERYLKIGRPDRAVRVYRRILLKHPGDRRLELRVRQLAAQPVDGHADDLSEELTDPGLVPAEPSLMTTVEAVPPAPPRPIEMPPPSLVATPAPSDARLAAAVEDADDELPTDPKVKADAESPADDEDTDLDVQRLAEELKREQTDETTRRQRRRRRSLIRK